MKLRDKRRKHKHWTVTVQFGNGEEFSRVFVDRDKADALAVRQNKLPEVEIVWTSEVDCPDDCH